VSFATAMLIADRVADGCKNEHPRNQQSSSSSAFGNANLAPSRAPRGRSGAFGGGEFLQLIKDNAT
jgi:hypothetical protein